MLDRILNINTHEKYRSGSSVSSSNAYHNVHRRQEERNHSKDSALFSPLAKLLSKINWKIIRVETISKDETLFEFLIGDTEFKTVINFQELYTEPFQQFGIKKTIISKCKDVNCMIKLKVEKDEVSTLARADLISIDTISSIYKKITAEELYLISSVDPIYLNSIIFGKEDNLANEFNYILKVIYTFISSKNKSKIKNKIFLKSHKNIPIIMQNVVFN